MLISVDSVSVRFGERTVFRDVTFDVNPGELISVMGPSGSGKSTLLACLGGLIRPTGGRIVRDDVLQRSLAWVFQTTNILSNRTCFENVELGTLSRRLGRSQARRCVSAALDTVGIGHLASQRSGRLSGGERQRLVIARALVSQPALLIADEPTAQLDRTSADHVVGALIATRAQGTAVIIASHDPAVAGRCERQLEFEDGTLVAKG